MPRIIYPTFYNYAIILAMIVHLSFRSWIETLDAWSLGTYLWQPAQENTVLSPKTDPLWPLSNSEVSSCR
jgi:hypothetical protein